MVDYIKKSPAVTGPATDGTDDYTTQGSVGFRIDQGTLDADHEIPARNRDQDGTGGPDVQISVGIDAHDFFKADAEVLENRIPLANASFQVAQEGTTKAGVGALASEYTLDQVEFITAGSPQARVSVTQRDAALFAGHGKSLQITATTAEAAVAAGELLAWRMPVEAQMLQHLEFGAAGAKVTVLRFSIFSTETGIHCVALEQEDGNRSLPIEYTVGSPSTVTEFTIVFSGDTAGTINDDSGAGLWLVFPLVAGSDFQGTEGIWPAGTKYATANQQNLLDGISNQFIYSPLSWTVGAPANFTKVPFDVELQRCQRYLIGGAGHWGQFNGIRMTQQGANTIDFRVDVPTNMRVTPALVGVVEATDFNIALITSALDTGYTLAMLSGTGTNSFLLRATQTTHGLTDAQLQLISVFLDARMS